MKFTENIAKQLLCSADAYPVDFEDAMEWWEAKTKSGNLVAKKDLKDKLEANFIEGIDYIVDNDRYQKNDFSENFPKNRKGRPVEVIRLTVECFKMMGMMIAGERGNQIRRYFIQCETELKRHLEEERLRYRKRVISAVVDKNHTPWVKRFEDEFFTEAYRITGRERPEKGHPGWMGTFINNNVYDLFPEGVSVRLREVNPRINGSRKRKHHQHLTKNIGRQLLDYQKGVTIAVMRLSPSHSPLRFKQNMQRACGGAIQIELPFMDDMDIQAS